MRLRSACAFAVAAALAACASPAVPPHAAAPAAAVAGPAPVSYDWHPLIIMPFGTLLQAIPLALHEVLLFHDAAHPVGGSDEGDCFAIGSAPPPQWAGRRPDEYYLCFVHDRLDRIEASVRLPADGAAVFAAACAQWLEGAAPAAPSADTCEGRDGAIGFRARLGDGPQLAAAAGEPAPSARTLSISVFSVTP